MGPEGLLPHSQASVTCPYPEPDQSTESLFYTVILTFYCFVCVTTDYGLDGPGSNPGGDEVFRPSRPALEPT